MTNPVILLGTQSNGETLPVQVDGFGRLVAEGLQGPPGPEGPPGAGLPPDPYEGALLGWLNGELSWVGGSVPVPEGVFGPILSWDRDAGYLEIEGPIPESIGNGVYVYQCDADGVYYTDGWDISQTWSSSVINAVPTPSYEYFNLFDGKNTTYYTRSDTGQSISMFTGFEVITSLSILGTRYTAGPAGGGSIIVNLGENDEVNITNQVPMGSNPATGVAVETAITGVSSFKSLTIEATGSGNGSFLAGIKVNNKSLVDTNQSLNLRVNQLLGNGLLGVPSANKDFTVGSYLKTPEQRVAPWVLYGNDPTSLIDHLRRSRD